MIQVCPQCGGTASLLQTRTDYEELPDLDQPGQTRPVPIKVEEFRCQDPGCEFEFERIVREPN